MKRESLLEGAEFIAGRGYRVDYRDDIFAQSGYLAGDDGRRTAELKGHLKGGDSRALFLARGGYGSSRIVEHLPFAAIRRERKIIAGYSDATALLLAVLQRSGLAVIHGPFVSEGERGLSRLLRTCSGKIDPLVFTRLRPLRRGQARGALTGGNLSILAHSIGTSFEVETEGRILFVEETNEPPYRIDRMVRQLVLAGKFRRIRGLVIGHLTGLTRKERYLAERLFVEAAGERKIPVAAGFPAGHGRRNAAFPLGTPAFFDGTEGTVTFSPFLLADGR